MKKIINSFFFLLSFNAFSNEFSLTTDAFKSQEKIPQKYTCQGPNIQPSLFWKTLASAKSYALIMNDPDAPNKDWVHWIVFNITENKIEPNHTYPLGKNSWGNTKYQGPCPPSGTHRYYFKLYALDTQLSLNAPDKKTLLKAIKSHILAQDEIMGTVDSSKE